MSAVFITATGTDIGKTYLAAGLIRHWRAAGYAAEALKPLATGFAAEDATSSDAGMLLAASGRPVTAGEIDRISPFRFKAPLSPDMAAKREGRRVDFPALVDFCRSAIAAPSGPLLIEGIGGVMVPLDENHTVLDWMAALGIPVLVVAGSYLGSLSHALTALDVLAHKGLAVRALVVNETPNSTVALAGTIETLQRFAGAVPVIALRRGSGQNFAAIAALL